MPPSRWLLLLAWVPALLLVACAGAGGPVSPSPVALQPTPAPDVHPFVPGVHRYVGEGDRLEIPTPTPVPTLTPLPVRDGGGKRVSAEMEQEAAASAVPLETSEEPRSCIDHYRAMLIEYRGRVPFSSQVALQLSRELGELRPDCPAQGWAPRFEPGLVCVTGSVSEVPISPRLTQRRHSLSTPQPLPTARDDRGNILVHFARLPLRDEAGCWYYRASRDAWAWLVSGVDSGVDRPRFPACDGLSRSLLAALTGEFGPLQIARALDKVRLQLPSECGSPLWDIFPASGSHEDCGVPGGTGRSPDGFLVVTWHEEHLPADGAVCWVLFPGGSEWRPYYPKEDEG